MSDRRLILIDGFSLLYRAFFGGRFMSTSDGRPTNALFGFCSMVFRVIQDVQPDAILVAMDSPGKTFRHAEYAEYKGTRREMPEEMKSQIPLAKEMIAALGLPSIELTGYEADDIIGTLSRQAEEHGYRTAIITGDHDALQLVDDYVTVVTPKTGVTDMNWYDAEAVVARYGFGPEYLADYKALAGDSSDNIPGVPGIGDKSASALIQKFGPVEKLIEHMDEVEEKFRKKLLPNLDVMAKFKQLCTIDRHAPIEWDFAPYEVSAERLAEAEQYLTGLEFRSLVKRLPVVLAPYTSGGVPAVTSVAENLSPHEPVPLSNLEALEKWLAGKPYARLDRQPSQGDMFGESSTRALIATGAEMAEVSAEIADELLARDPSRASLHDAKPVIARLLAAQNQVLPPVGFDTLLGAYLLQPGRSHYALRDVISRTLDVSAPESEEQLAMGLALSAPQMAERIKLEGQDRILNEIELPLTPVLAEMEAAGIMVNREFLDRFSDSLREKIAESQARIYEMAGNEFAIGSPKQLGEILFERMGLPGPKKTKTGYATGAEILQALAGSHPIAGEVLSWREFSKLKSTYSDSLPKMIGSDGRIHTSFNQAVAATGRLSSNEPNLQNIPIRTELGRQIRNAFVAAPGYQLACLDYSQIELRLLAHLCEDPILVEAFRDRVDVHTATAALMFHVEQNDVTKEQRRLAKMLNYAVLYGVSDFGLAQQLGADFSVSEAKALIQQYFERFPTVKQYTDGVIEDARAKGFTVTLLGRRRYFPEIHAANRNERMMAERQAVNAPIQGAAADMIKVAMLQVHEALKGCRTRMLLQVHDELVFELAEGEEGKLRELRTIMEEAMPVNVPIEVDVKLGPNWNSLTTMEREAL